VVRINDVQLSGSLENTFNELFELIPANEIIDIARAEPGLAKGFRLTLASAPALRKRMHTEFCRAPEHNHSILSTLRSNSLCGQLLTYLSEASIESYAQQLCNYFGYDRINLAFILDRRPRVRLLGERNIHENAGVTSDDRTRELARKFLYRELNQPLKLLGSLLPMDTAPTIPAQPTGETASDKKLQQQLRQQQIQTDKQQRHNQKLQAQLETAAAELQQNRDDNRTLREQLGQHRQSLLQLEQQLLQSQNETEQRIQQQLQIGYSKLSRRWLHDSQQLEEAIQTSDDTLLDDVNHALSVQAERDQHYGNRQTAKKQLEALVFAQSRLEDALINSFKPSRQLGTLREQLDARVQALQKILDHDDNHQSGLLRELMLRVNNSETTAEIDDIHGQAQYLHAVKLIDDYELDAVLKHRGKKMERVIDQFSTQLTPSVPDNMRLRREIAAATEAAVLIDGHNCLLSVAAITQRFTNKKEASGEIGRRWLAMACERIFREQPNVETTIYFDSADSGVHHHSNAVKIVYSGGTGDQKADHAILEQLAYMQMMNVEASSYVFTNDLDLRKKATALGANSADVEFLHDWYLLCAP